MDLGHATADGRNKWKAQYDKIIIMPVFLNVSAWG